MVFAARELEVQHSNNGGGGVWGHSNGVEHKHRTGDMGEVPRGREILSKSVVSYEDPSTHQEWG